MEPNNKLIELSALNRVIDVSPLIITPDTLADFSRYLLDGAFACYTTIPKTYSLVTHSH